MPPINTPNSVTGDVSDNDMSGNDSDHSNTSHENDAIHESTEDEPDSDDSSEMDETECETRRNTLLQHVQDLENQFNHLREQLYRERLTQVECQLSEVKSGKSHDYLISLQELQENMRIRTEVAGIVKQLKLQNIDNQYEAEEQAALQNFESEKTLACDYYYSELMETIRRLEEDRHNSEISWGEGGEWGSRSRSRSRRKAVTVSGPYIVYMLKPQDILEDWTIIRKALKRTS
ncbi:breast cancer metastasis-suppressor 1-like protein [Diorhabda carinulata]|uniref:breast cancer metastasis-suppressor 1-like protein n=1 Tax=Diorhabda sublineata TaxID=1163346 RepID=UPI0024E1681F|nr:breast cancer metastasis-suppressor 1-like protein [Diorhabda sublineata]XP_057672454.1 breast cancer metastasis-suppressor 1-like protein [Diorhabda carinulata]